MAAPGALERRVSHGQGDDDLDALSRPILTRRKDFIDKDEEARKSPNRVLYFRRNADYDRLIEACGRKLRDNPRNVRALLIRASSYSKKGGWGVGRVAAGPGVRGGRARARGTRRRRRRCCGRCSGAAGRRGGGGGEVAAAAEDAGMASVDGDAWAAAAVAAAMGRARPGRRASRAAPDSAPLPAHRAAAPPLRPAAPQAACRRRWTTTTACCASSRAAWTRCTTAGLCLRSWGPWMTRSTTSPRC
jgi:hypothetical protein